VTKNSRGDRVVQAAAKIVIEPIFEPDFLDCSFGFRPRRSARQARERVRMHVQRERRHVVVDADIEGFFDNLDRGILMRLLRERISDRRVLALIDRWLRAGVLAEGALLHPETGTPQGGVISPLLANVYLSGLDQAFEERHAKLGQLVRYADDLVLCCWKPGQAKRACEALASDLAALGLRLSEQKTRIVTLEVGGEGFDFLGFHFRRVQSRSSGKPFIACWPSQTVVAAARQRVRDLTPLGRLGLPAIMVVQDLNRFLQGWRAYFRYGNSTQQLHALDRYVFWRLSRFLTLVRQARIPPRDGAAARLPHPARSLPPHRNRPLRVRACRAVNDVGEPCEGKPHARFVGGREEAGATWSRPCGRQAPPAYPTPARSIGPRPPRAAADARRAAAAALHR
jgi:RNA-directed DNA polymerase